MFDLRETASNLCKRLIALLCAAFFFIAVLILVAGGLITADIDKYDAVLSPGEAWFDDWYTITRIDDVTFAIGEPRYWQLNYNNGITERVAGHRERIPGAGKPVSVQDLPCK